ncbi:MAG: tRNA(Met) cytidine acetyltransferase [Hahellaceae bacterium]|nr:tRNA(Met) cytidine acetyltransferase [Hahellaceae bacterium]MCP5170498.1 tRNA(Met) cytidine acetyltransferase [Hahellaceae bacterium]
MRQEDSPCLLSLWHRAQQSNHRYLIWVYGDQSAGYRWVHQQLIFLSQHMGAHSPCELFWVGNAKSAQVAGSQHMRLTSIPAIQARRWLGGESDFLVFDAWEGLNPDGLGAISGTLRGGGLCFLLSPAPACWPFYDDPDYVRIRSQIEEGNNRPKLFLQRFSARLSASLNDRCEGVFQYRVDHLASPPPEVLKSGEQEPVGLARVHSSDLPVDPAGGKVSLILSAEQQAAVDALVRVVTGHRKRPVVLTADRGRGKSAALGVAAARLLSEQPRHLIITAPQDAAIQSAMAFFALSCPEAERIDNGYRLPNGSRFEFIPPDVLIRERLSADAVWVDEAAGLPVALLEQLLRDHARIAFASTLHGYEGAGRGFGLRFRKILDRRTPQWRLLHLAAPIRWADHDPLEQLVFNLLALDAEPFDDREALKRQALPVSQWQFKCIDASSLCEDENLLRQVFGLLVLAHYQTSPDDLRVLLDHEGVLVWCLVDGDHVGGVALTIAEGGLSLDLHADIAAGRRRLRGHLLPQALAYYSGMPAILSVNGWRIMRIAVHPLLQRQGMGQALIHGITAQAKAQGIDWVGTSFGITRELLAFWRSTGMQPVRLGLQKDTASGEQALLMFCGLSKAAQALSVQARASFLRELLYHVNGVYKALAPGLVGDLVRAAADLKVRINATDVSASEVNWAAVRAFALGERPVESCAPFISDWLLWWLSSADELDSTLEAEIELLIAAIWQKQSRVQLETRFALKGRKSIERAMRSAVAVLLNIACQFEK